MAFLHPTGLIDIGYTVPAHAWNMGPGPGPSYSETGHKHEWSMKTAETTAQDLVRCAEALAAHPLINPGG